MFELVSADFMWQDKFPSDSWDIKGILLDWLQYRRYDTIRVAFLRSVFPGPSFMGFVAVKIPSDDIKLWILYAVGGEIDPSAKSAENYELV